MRFDDMIATVLAQPARSAATGARRSGASSSTCSPRRAPARSEARARVRLPARPSRARSIQRSGARPPGARWPAWRSIPTCSPSSPRTAPAVAAPLIAGARLDDADWLGAASPARPDGAGAAAPPPRPSGPRCGQALGAVRPERLRPRERSREPSRRRQPTGAGAERSESQIRELVERIEAFRRPARGAGASESPMPSMPSRAGRGLPLGDRRPTASSAGSRARRAGRWSARASPPSPSAASTASTARPPARSRSARRSATPASASPAQGPAAGDWRISGVPFFDPAARQLPRLSRHRAAAAARRGRPQRRGRGRRRCSARTCRPNSLRQLIHELRTPLNAIIGFAEMIEGQYMGPAAASYRGRASRDHGAGAPAALRGRRSRHRGADRDPPLRARRKLGRRRRPARAAARMPMSAWRASAARASRSRSRADLPPAQVELGAAERMFARHAGGDDRPRRGRRDDRARRWRWTQLGGRRCSACRSTGRARSTGVDEAALLDPGYSPEGDWPGAPALGLGFALRLVRNLAEAVGGALVDRRGPLLALSAACSGRPNGPPGRADAAARPPRLLWRRAARSAIAARRAGPVAQR